MVDGTVLCTRTLRHPTRHWDWQPVASTSKVADIIDGVDCDDCDFGCAACKPGGTAVTGSCEDEVAEPPCSKDLLGKSSTSRGLASACH